MKPWCSIGTLAALCAAMALKFHHVRFSMPDIAWWGWPIVLLAGVALNFGFLFWLGRMGIESREVPGAKHLQAAAAVVLALLVFL